jgi:UDPglucose 6-dehydrogenase
MRVQVVGQGLLAETYTEGCHGYAAFGLQVVDTDPDILWVCYDTPVIADVPDVDWVCDRISEHLETLDPACVVLLSSQVPVGTCARLEHTHPDYRFVVNPENIRRGHALMDFFHPGRHIIGARHREPLIQDLLGLWTSELLWMSPESAEMVKHALNGFLALSVVYGMEVADLCERVGADPQAVLWGAATDQRVGRRSYIAPKGPYTGGTLGRDVHVLNELGGGPVIRAIPESNKARL